MYRHSSTAKTLVRLIDEVIINMKKINMYELFRTHPSKRVLRYAAGNLQGLEFRLLEEDYNAFFSPTEQKSLLYKTKGKTLFNGSIVRMVSIDENVVTLQRARFFDFMTSNLIRYPNSSSILSLGDRFKNFILDKNYRSKVKLESSIISAIKRHGKLRSFDDVLAVDELANAVAVSVVLRDSLGNVLLIRRGITNAITSGNFVVSATGGMSCEDLTADNPFLHAGIRETLEELGLRVNPVLTDIAIVKQKMQPVVFMDAVIDGSMQTFVDTIRESSGFYKENTAMYIVPHDRILSVVKGNKFTDASAFHLAGKSSQREWSMSRGCSINRYLV